MIENDIIILKDSNSFSEGSYRVVGVLLVVFVIGLFPLFLSGYYPICLYSGIAIAVLMGRQRITVLKPKTKEIIQHVTVFSIKIPSMTQFINPESINKVALRFYSGNFTRVARRSNIPTRFDIKEFYIDLDLKSSKKKVRLRILPTYEEALELGRKVSEIWDIKFIDYIKIRDEKAKKKKIERKKRGLR